MIQPTRKKKFKQIQPTRTKNNRILKQSTDKVQMEKKRTCSLQSSKTVTEKLNRDVEVDSELARSNSSSKLRAYKPRSWVEPS